MRKFVDLGENLCTVLVMNSGGSQIWCGSPAKFNVFWSSEFHPYHRWESSAAHTRGPQTLPPTPVVDPAYYLPGSLCGKSWRGPEGNADDGEAVSGDRARVGLWGALPSLAPPGISGPAVAGRGPKAHARRERGAHWACAWAAARALAGRGAASCPEGQARVPTERRGHPDAASGRAAEGPGPGGVVRARRRAHEVTEAGQPCPFLSRRNCPSPWEFVRLNSCADLADAELTAALPFVAATSPPC